jgi:hypothetical protein
MVLNENEIIELSNYLNEYYKFSSKIINIKKVLFNKDCTITFNKDCTIKIDFENRCYFIYNIEDVLLSESTFEKNLILLTNIEKDYSIEECKLNWWHVCFTPSKQVVFKYLLNSI